MRIFTLTLLAGICAMALGAARADVAPEPPMDPVDEACKPFFGIWQRTEVEPGAGATLWTLVAFDLNGATLISYADYNGIDVKTTTYRFTLACAAQDSGVVRLTLGWPEIGGIPIVYDATLVDAATFTFPEAPAPLRGPPMPPPPGATPPTPTPVTVTFKRILP